MLVDTAASKSRAFFRVLVSPLVHRYQQDDPRQYPWLEQNMANIVSVFRIIASILIVAGLVTASSSGYRYLWLFLAVINIATDGIDGEIARGLKTESNFGKAIDPLADKITFAALAIGLIPYFTTVLGYTPTSFVVVVVCALLLEIRVLITGARVGYLAKKAGTKPNGANSFGKVKFGLQCLAVMLGWGIPNVNVAVWISSILISIGLYFSVMSRRGYIKQLNTIRAKFDIN